VIGGRTLKEHLRFSIAYWHSFRGIGSDPFGPGTIVRPWERGKDPVSIAKKRMDVAFEFYTKIEAPFYCFHDRDIAPEGRSLKESNRNLDKIVAHAKQLQKATGVGHRQPVLQPALHVRRGHQSRRARVRLRGGTGEEGDGRDQGGAGRRGAAVKSTKPCSTPTCMCTRSFPT
jgi:hypothetical protein